jgi:hypothetical protein
MARYEFTDKALTGYTWDSVERTVYSTKRPGAPRALTWSCPSPSSPRRVSLYTKWGNKVSYSEPQIVAMLKGVSVDSEANQKTSEQVLANLKNPVTKGTYIVVLVEDGRLKPSSNAKRHPTLLEAQREAERLAKTVIGSKFCVLQDCGTVQAAGVVWG